jgi:hypothetical protein
MQSQGARKRSLFLRPLLGDPSQRHHTDEDVGARISITGLGDQRQRVCA